MKSKHFPLTLFFSLILFSSVSLFASSRPDPEEDQPPGWFERTHMTETFRVLEKLANQGVLKVNPNVRIVGNFKRVNRQVIKELEKNKVLKDYYDQKINGLKTDHLKAKQALEFKVKNLENDYSQKIKFYQEEKQKLSENINNLDDKLIKETTEKEALQRELENKEEEMKLWIAQSLRTEEVQEAVINFHTCIKERKGESPVFKFEEVNGCLPDLFKNFIPKG